MQLELRALLPLLPLRVIIFQRFPLSTSSHLPQASIDQEILSPLSPSIACKCLPTCLHSFIHFRCPWSSSCTFGAPQMVIDLFTSRPSIRQWLLISFLYIEALCEAMVIDSFTSRPYDRQWSLISLSHRGPLRGNGHQSLYIKTLCKAMVIDFLCLIEALCEAMVIDLFTSKPSAKQWSLIVYVTSRPSTRQWL